MRLALLLVLASTVLAGCALPAPRDSVGTSATTTSQAEPAPSTLRGWFAPVPTLYVGDGFGLVATVRNEGPITISEGVCIRETADLHCEQLALAPGQRESFTVWQAAVTPGTRTFGLLNGSLAVQTTPHPGPGDLVTGPLVDVRLVNHTVVDPHTIDVTFAVTFHGLDNLTYVYFDRALNDTRLFSWQFPNGTAVVTLRASAYAEHAAQFATCLDSRCNGITSTYSPYNPYRWKIPGLQSASTTTSYPPT